MYMYSFIKQTFLAFNSPAIKTQMHGNDEEIFCWIISSKAKLCMCVCMCVSQFHHRNNYYSFLYDLCRYSYTKGLRKAISILKPAGRECEKENLKES